jgi:hypothetical protein
MSIIMASIISMAIINVLSMSIIIIIINNNNNQSIIMSMANGVIINGVIIMSMA